MEHILENNVGSKGIISKTNYIRNVYSLDYCLYFAQMI